MNTPALTLLTLYYDGACPLCRAQTAKLKRWDRHGSIDYVDIAAPGFDPAPLGLDLASMNREVYSRTADGRLLAGLDTIVATYEAVGQGWRVAPLRLALLRAPLAAAYRVLARERYRLSRWLGRDVTPCRDGVCSVRGGRARGRT
ncbi:MAG: thiol-disulfide oxidoreductase DCC family protein [Gammaproteobacteria bacterium]